MSGTASQFLVEGVALFCLKHFVEKAKSWDTTPVRIDVYEGKTCAVIRVTFDSQVKRNIYTEDLGKHLGLNPMLFQESWGEE